MTAQREQASATGGRTLEVFANTPQLNEWIYSKLASGVRGEVLEIGSGIGNMSRLMLPHATHLVLTDTEPHYLQDLASEFAGDDRVEVAAYDLDGPPPPTVAARRYDTIFAVNVIEHIADDHTLVSRLAELLRPGGRLLVYVPACPIAFGSLDEALGHYRRYTPDTLAALMRGGGLEPTSPRYVNLLGLAGWFVNGKLLKKRLLPASGVALFEKLVPVVRLEDRVELPFGLGLFTQAAKPA
jgi:SAM-dependent methyltransferase